MQRSGRISKLFIFCDIKVRSVDKKLPSPSPFFPSSSPSPLQCVDPGGGGEHMRPRGFLATNSWPAYT